MKPDEIENKVRALISEEIGIDSEKILPSTQLIKDLGLDSFDVMSLISLLETQINREFDEEKLFKLVTFQDVVDLVRQELSKSDSA